MKNYFVIVVIFFIINKGWTQNTNLYYKNAIKIYNLTTFEEYREFKSDTSAYSFQFNTAALQILHPALAFQWKTNKNNFHEIELTNFMLNKVKTNSEIVNDSTGNREIISGNDLISTLISLRYEYILNFNKSKDKKLVPSIGFGVNPYFKQNNSSPKISNSFHTSEVIFGTRTFITPRLTYYIKQKFFVDINIPLCFSETYYLRDRKDNPNFPANQRTITTYNFDLFPNNFSGRLGVGLKL